MSLISPGRVVQSLAGRDKGCFFIVWQKSDEHYVELVDGHLRRVEKPKRKKVKHVQITEWLHEGIARAIAEGKSLTDQQVRDALEEAGCLTTGVVNGKEDGIPNVETGRH